MIRLPDGELYLEDDDICEFAECSEPADCVLVSDVDENEAHGYCDVHGGIMLFAKELAS